MLAVRSLCLTEPYWASAGGGWGTRQGHHLLDGQAELEPVQRVADANLPLNLCVWQICHDGAALYVGTACCHVPRRHADPQLGTKKWWIIDLCYWQSDWKHTQDTPQAMSQQLGHPMMQKEGLDGTLLPTSHVWQRQKEVLIFHFYSLHRKKRLKPFWTLEVAGAFML